MYLIIDGDDVGRELERYVLTQDLSGLQIFTELVTTLLNGIGTEAESLGGKVVWKAGDSLILEFNNSNIKKITSLVKKLKEKVAFSMGSGNELRDAWVALKFAKAHKPSSVNFMDGKFEFLM